MTRHRLRTVFLVGVLIAWITSPSVIADPTFVGPKVCSQCHKAEEDVWYHSKHQMSYAKLHKRSLSKKLTAAIGGPKSAKKNPACVACHYSLIARAGRKRARPRAGPSCESCHGAGSEWLDIHHRLGRFRHSAEEPTDTRRNRLSRSAKAGMIHSDMRFELANTCMRCHGLARADLAFELQAKLMAAGHPVDREFEVVRYSQGSIRHRFYPPDFRNNKSLNDKQLAEWLVIGAAAQLVAAHAAQAGSSDQGYRNLQRARADAASAILRELSLPEAKALLTQPSQANARRLTDRLEGADLSALARRLPSKTTYR
ncbi:MAG: multiheme c-type cytochrome [Pseudomonadota bacterium]